jgi:hypothetical protein
MNLDVNLRLPAFFTTSLVVEAYEGALHYRAIIRKLRGIGAIETESAKPMHVDPEILRDEIPTIYHRCVQLILESRMAGNDNAERKKRNPMKGRKLGPRKKVAK